MMSNIRLFLVVVVWIGCASAFAEGRTEFDGIFAPSEGWVKPPEAEFRDEICLNGIWQFQPVAIPHGWQPNRGTPPELTPPKTDAWETIPIKIPSPWNVNTWGNGRHVGAGTHRPYFPDSVYYPSYPEHWDSVRMAWIQRPFTLPKNCDGKRILLHFEAISGMAEIYVNGKKTGENFGRFLPLEIDITNAVLFDGKPNELTVGVRSLRLFDKTSDTYSKMRTPYAPGSNMDNIDGIWGDVYLLTVPGIRIEDVFVKPFVHRDTLELEITLKNDLTTAQKIAIEGGVFAWHNKADQTLLLEAPEPRWELDKTNALPFKRSDEFIIPPGESVTIRLSEKVGNALEFWTMDSPNLYGLVLDVYADGKKVDTKYTRFGWREFRIVGKNLELNGKPVQLMGDLLHPFGPFISSRRYVWSWYTMVKEMHGNAVRPHAQPHPRIFAELADEMGLAVLAETAMFGSSIQLNFEDAAAWDRYTEHYKKMILRDRNHPSIFGWSWGNELFAIFIYDEAITPEQTDIWYKRLIQYGESGMQYDPTRNWYSCDGDEDMRGSMPVWNKHFGHGTGWKNELPTEMDKPMMVGEQGGTYYARPGQLSVFNGNRAYENYLGRNEALAIDVYENIVQIALPKLTFFSPAETAWFGIEHLNFGYSDFSRLPNQSDGVFFTRPFEEGSPGVQIERLPPYVCTFNPGWDKALPLFKPLPMFEAQKSALDPSGPKPWKTERRFDDFGPGNIASACTKKVLFLGDVHGELYKRLTEIGVPLVLSTEEIGGESEWFIIIDGNTFQGEAVSQIETAYRTVAIFRAPTEIPKALQKYLGNTKLVARTATQLKEVNRFYYAQFFDKSGLYFAEEPRDRHVIKCAFDTNLSKEAKIYYTAADTDWSLFNGSPESAKCAAIVLYEALQKPSGTAVIGCPTNHNELLAVTVDVIPTSPKNIAFWKMLLWGVEFVQSEPDGKTDVKVEHDLLLDGPQNIE